MFGIEHILQGIDSLLFVGCLILICGTGRRILVTVTGFTIALSIVFLAREIAVARRDSLTGRHPIAVSSSFGLLHGLGFASALREIGLPQGEIPAALLSFNVGVEIGQLLFVVAVVLVLWTVRRSLPAIAREPGGPIAHLEKPVAYLIGAVATFWTFERLATFWA